MDNLKVFGVTVDLRSPDSMHFVLVAATALDVYILVQEFYLNTCGEYLKLSRCTITEVNINQPGLLEL